MKVRVDREWAYEGLPIPEAVQIGVERCDPPCCSACTGCPNPIYEAEICSLEELLALVIRESVENGDVKIKALSDETFEVTFP